MTTDTLGNAGFWRRMAALLYDGFLLTAIWVASTTAIVALQGDADLASGIAFQLFLYTEAAIFFVYFWHFKGQTLGMQVWKIRAVNDAGEILSLAECLVRFFFATFSLMFLGLGFVWIIFDRNNLAWHDHASGSRVIYLGANPYQNSAD